MSSSEDAAAAAAAALIADQGNEAPEDPASGSEEVAVEFPSFDIQVPADLLAELEEEDPLDDEITIDEINRLAEETGEENPDVLRRLAEAERRAAHYEKLRVKEAKKNWVEEAKTHFPLSEPFLDEINATSRRGFLRTAKNIHARMQPLVEEKVLKPAREVIAAEREKTVTEAKEKAKEAWGEPVVEDQSQEPPVSAEIARHRLRRGDFSDTVRSMLFPKGS